MTEEQVTQLQDALKRCPPGTFEAACEFRRTRSTQSITAVVSGVIERYVEREFRWKLRQPADSLRLIEDLGIDSLTMMEIVLLTEDVLEISVSNEELTKLRTFGEVRQFILTKVGAPLTTAAVMVPSTH